MHELKLPNGRAFFALNRGECAFLYEEIFTRRCYADRGIVLDRSPDGCILDVGANIGMATYFFHTEFPGKKIHAFEPSPKTFEVLAANVKAIGIDAELYRCALSSSEGKALLRHYPNNSIMSGLYADAEQDSRTTKTYMKNEGITEQEAAFLVRDAFRAESFECELRPLSAILDERAIARVDLLKIDVEKAELDVLAGIREEHWSRIRQAIVEVHDLAGRLAAVRDLFERHGLRVTVTQDPKLAGTDLYDLVAVR